MIDSRTIAILHDIIRRERRSFLSYLGDSLPWPTVEDRDVEAKLAQMIEGDRRATGELDRLLARHRIALPYLGVFPGNFTTSNFVSLRYLIPRLLSEQRRAIAALEKDVASLDDAEARAALQHLLDTKRRNLQELEAMSSPAPATATTTH